MKHTQRELKSRRAIIQGLATATIPWILPRALDSVIRQEPSDWWLHLIEDTRVFRSLTLPSAVVETIATHAESEQPNECCGLLAGVLNRADRYYPAANVAASPYTYQIAEREQVRIF